MEYVAHVAAVERECGAIVEALRGASRERQVPTCPDFALVDLVGHLGEFTALWTHVLAEAAGADKPPFAPLGADDQMDTWYRPLADHLIDQLHATTVDSPCWMWMPQHQTAGAVARRCANELTIHRYDVEAAVGAGAPLDAAVAIDAIDEFFDMLPVWDNPPEGSGQSLALHAEEGDRRRITLGPEGPRMAATSSPADLTLSGRASDLALVIFDRPPIGVVQRAGGGAALDAWYREFRFG